jgi:hypothetical protein
MRESRSPRKSGGGFDFDDVCVSAPNRDPNPQAWLAFVLAKMPDHPAKAIDQLLPWNWKAAQDAAVQPTPTTAAA